MSEPTGANASRISRTIREWGQTILLTLLLLVFIRTFLFQTFVIVSGSMEDTLLVGDFLTVNRLALGTRLPGTAIATPGYSRPERGDVLVIDPAHEDFPLVKRLIGMPGDTLEMREKLLYINGQAQAEPYLKRDQGLADYFDPEMSWQTSHLHPADDSIYRPTRDTWGPLVIPDGYYFLLGDNRESSRDSRYWGLVERWRLVGKASFRYFSYDTDSPIPLAILREIRWARIGSAIR